MTKVTFIRHAHSEANEKKVMSGDPGVIYHLSELGKEQLKQVSFDSSDLLVSSDFTRAIETAQALFPQQEILINPLFRELQYGPYEKQDIMSIIDEYYLRYLNDEKHDGMSNYSETQKRALEALIWLYEISKEKGYQSITVISHAGFLRMIKVVLNDVAKEDYRLIHFQNLDSFETQISESQYMQYLDQVKHL